ncbi:dTDP-glucose 4,6-dehydratase [Streptomyces sp. BPTC-684]|uniref:dTDP-glucose 4,6-dehydratase n=1 Tax=Streptomyces sp. BPTC-684 TaxID=3043734 RepID=UPI0024B0E4C7|nr:dTDP-glucose 4,6-dehydratase [Streptomyces sp. BPTC-684]WHM36511.1 dTDP-glucose 4,6-dehydratase [Streptomyces sp. BPTC-684]
MKLLVTGAAGFIGSHYVRTMLAGGYPGWEDCRITVLDKLGHGGHRENLPAGHPRLDFVRGDVCDVPLLLDLLPGHDAVVHFAAESHVDRSIDDASDFIRTNVDGTHALLAACREAGIERIVHVSTDEVYGSVEHGASTETAPLLPNSPYAASKAAADLIVRSFVRTHGLDVSITRCSNNYGPHQDVEKLIPLFLTNLMEGVPVPLYGDGRNVREWLHVDDHCRAIQLVLTKGSAGEIYNVGGGNAFTNNELTGMLLDLAGADESMIRRVADRPGHDLRYAIDETKIREQLGYRPQVPFDKGLADTFAWYRDHPEWWKPLKQDVTR